MSVDKTLRNAAKLAKQGDRAGAARLYQAVLAQFPGNASARRGLAALATQSARPGAPSPGAAAGGRGPSPQQMQALSQRLQRGDTATVIAEAQRLARLFPKAPGLINLLGLAQMRAGKRAEAVESFARVNTLDPKFAGAFGNKASALAQLGRHGEAKAAAEAALALDPRLVQGQLMLGFALVNLGEPERALTAFEAATRLAPKLPQAFVGLGNAQAAMGKARDALAAFEKARALDPDNVDVLNNIGNALSALERLDEAAEALRLATAIAPERAILHANYAQALRTSGRVAAALDSAKTAVDLDPSDPSSWALMGDCLRELGDSDAAKEALDKAIAMDPDHQIGFAARWRMEPLPLDHPEFARMTELAADPALGQVSRGLFEHALFLAYDAADDTDQAFAHLHRAKEIRRAGQPYDMDRQLEVLATMEAQFAEGIDVLDSESCAEIPPPRRPVFIVGMPRSGTSLVEQILASHSEVHAAGELPTLASAMARLGWTEKEAGQPPDRAALRALRRDYFAELARFDTDRPVVTDKAPINFRHLGHALAAMPEATVLFLRRDARATGWSNYSHLFLGKANNFGNDLADIGRMYLAHLDLLALWARLFPDRITVVPYERLTEHQEEETRKLLAAVDLDWEEGCLNFHETRRAVKTASAAQVRRKIYTGSSEAWRRYERFLGPMLDVLGDVV